MENVMFWIGIIAGIFIGANIGIVTAGLLFSAKEGKRQHLNAVKQESSFEIQDKTLPKNRPQVICT